MICLFKTMVGKVTHPGHHAGRTNCAGFCYLNSAAMIAKSLKDGWPELGGKVMVLRRGNQLLKI
jgi:acetoin utilization deacetylase AcuC-like enzyme